MPRKIRENHKESDGLLSPSRLASQARELIRLGLLWQKSTQRSPVLRSVNIYPPSASRNGMWLCIGKGWDDGTKVVTFYRTSSLLAALLGLLWSIERNTARWQPDTYAEK